LGGGSNNHWQGILTKNAKSYGKKLRAMMRQAHGNKKQWRLTLAN
jgi:hypothetical protein